jgi:cytochrome c oxidase subunit IV
MVENQVNHGCCVQHRVKALYMCIAFFIVFRQVGSELVDEHFGGQGIMGWCAVDLFALVLDPADFLSD